MLYLQKLWELDELRSYNKEVYPQENVSCVAQRLGRLHHDVLTGLHICQSAGAGISTALPRSVRPEPYMCHRESCSVML
jgi:hypothetical protein